MKFSKIAVMGPGLLGGSLALAIRARGLSERLTLFTRNATSAESLRHAGVAQEITTDAARAVEGAEFIIMCVPIGAMRSIAEAMKPKLDPFAIITDVASVKSVVVHEFEDFFNGIANWVGSHPMAGSEKSGFSAAREDLFEGAQTLVTPVESTDANALDVVVKFWQALGSTVRICSPEEHDRRVAEVSHLPHLVAAALARSVDLASLPFSGPGFRDTTRVAGGPAAMWAEILTTNRTSVLKSLEALLQNTQQAQKFIEQNDCDGLRDWLAHAAQIRSNIH